MFYENAMKKHSSLLHKVALSWSLVKLNLCADGKRKTNKSSESREIRRESSGYRKRRLSKENQEAHLTLSQDQPQRYQLINQSAA
jgi:hypothetical protein